MKRSRLLNKYLENNNFNNRENIKQRNLCGKLLRTTKRKYYADLNINQIKDWKTTRHLYYRRRRYCKHFNEYSNIVPTLQIIENEDILINTNAIDDPIKRAILKYSFHPSVLKIKDMINIKEKFSFTIVFLDDIATIIKKPGYILCFHL